jgi:hypothetical protein
MPIRIMFLALLFSLPNAACGPNCFSEGEVLVVVENASGERVDADSVTFSREGTEGLAIRVESGVYTFDGDEGEYEVTVSYCGGERTLSDTVDLTHDRTCTDTDSHISVVSILVEPC